jgi:hypothetical protein
MGPRRRAVQQQEVVARQTGGSGRCLAVQGGLLIVMTTETALDGRSQELARTQLVALGAVDAGRGFEVLAMQLGRAHVLGIHEPRARRRGHRLLDAQWHGHGRGVTLGDDHTDSAGDARDRNNSKNPNCLASKQWSLLVWSANVASTRPST